jgi:hypothetical protein
MSPSFTKAIVCLFALPLLALGSIHPAQAEIIGTLPALEATQRQRDLDAVSTAFARDEVRRQFTKWGVEPAQVEARVAALTDEELRALAQKVDSMPAGAGVVEVIGIVFIVLLILELVGAIDIFKKFP